MSTLHVEHLVRTRKLIANREIHFICRALFYGQSYSGPTELYDIKYAIDRSLQGHSTLEVWLYSKGIDVFGAGADKMRDHRLAWIDQMIEYWRDK